MKNKFEKGDRVQIVGNNSRYGGCMCNNLALYQGEKGKVVDKLVIRPHSIVVKLDSEIVVNALEEDLQKI